MPPGCPEKLDLPFLRFTLTYNRRRRANNLALVSGFTGRKIILHGRSAARRFLRDISPNLAIPPETATNPDNDTRGPHG